MVRRNLSYNVIQLVDIIYTNYKKYKSYNDLNQRRTKMTHFNSVWSDISKDLETKLNKEYLKASKKQRVEAIQRFYDSLY